IRIPPDVGNHLQKEPMMQTLSPKQQEMLTDVSNMQGQYQAVDNQTGRALLRKKLIRQVNDRFETTKEGERLHMEIVNQAFEKARMVLND
ncbi:hypothetical protein ABG818_11020, partial [Bifidobacterium adolescentis]